MSERITKFDGIKGFWDSIGSDVIRSILCGMIRSVWIVDKLHIRRYVPSGMYFKGCTEFKEGWI